MTNGYRCLIMNDRLDVQRLIDRYIWIIDSYSLMHNKLVLEG